MRERTEEIGLVRALGASTTQVGSLFLTEAAAVALLRWLVPGLPVETPLSFVLLALGVSLVVGLVSGVTPARRACGCPRPSG